MRRGQVLIVLFQLIDCALNVIGFIDQSLLLPTKIADHLVMRLGGLPQGGGMRRYFFLPVRLQAIDLRLIDVNIRERRLRLRLPLERGFGARRL